MNSELVSKIKNEINTNVLKINDLREKYNRMKAEGASVSEINKVALEAQELYDKYNELKKDLADYTSLYNAYASEAGKSVLKSKDADSKKLKDSHDSFIAFQISLLFKYDLNAKTEDEEAEVVSHTKKHLPITRILSGVFALISALSFTYWLSGCNERNTNNSDNMAIIDEDNHDNESKPDLEPTKPAETEKEKPVTTSTPEETEKPNPVNEKFEQLNDFAYLKETSSLYDSSDDIKEEIEKIEKYQKVLRISTDGNYDYVQTEDMKYGYIKSEMLGVLPDLFVEVDISDQTVKLYKDNDVILTTLCVTGKDSTPTRIGYFPITYKTYDTYLRGPGYNSHVNYWMPFDGGIGFHDAAWRSEFGGDIHFNGGSHGCVNMPNDAAKTIYENVEAGSKVLVHN